MNSCVQKNYSTKEHATNSVFFVLLTYSVKNYKLCYYY